jgi:dihydrofolate reductase
MTMKHVVLMGRKTFDSLGQRPLPRRANIVLTRSASFVHQSVTVAHNIDQAIDIARAYSKKQRLFVIGGGSVYDQMLSVADELYLTQIQPRDPRQLYLFDEEFYGDTFFPIVNKNSWELCHVSRLYRAYDSIYPAPYPELVNYYFRFFKYGRKSSCGCTDVERRRVRDTLQTQGPIIFPTSLTLGGGINKSVVDRLGFASAAYPNL